MLLRLLTRGALFLTPKTGDAIGNPMADASNAHCCKTQTDWAVDDPKGPVDDNRFSPKVLQQVPRNNRSSYPCVALVCSGQYIAAFSTGGTC